VTTGQLTTTGQARRLDRRQLAWACGAVIFGGAPHMFAVTPWIPLCVLLIAIWRITAAARGWSLPSIWVRVPVTVAAFAGVAMSYHGVSGVEAGSALLLMMAGMKLLETRSERDRVLVVFIGYFLLFAVFLREQAIWSLGWLAGGALGVTAALAQSVRREDTLSPAAAIRISGKLLLRALPLALVLFVLFPRLPGPFIAVPTMQGGSISGLSDFMQPGDITNLGLSDEVAFRARFFGAAPSVKEMYWRGPVLDLFDGRRWSASPAPRAASPLRVEPRSTREFSYQIVLEPQGRRWLLALDTPVRWSAPRARLGPGIQLMSAEPVWERTAYRADSVPGGSVRTDEDPGNLQKITRLPPGRNPRTSEMAQRLRKQSSSDADFIANVLRFFQAANFRYSLTPPPLGLHAVDDFLFTTREGFCEHYASSLAAMARAAGIPARVVIGYQGGEANPFSDYWIVRQANAHAWVEVWLSGAWQRIDPTTAVAPERIEDGVDTALASSAAFSGRLWRSSQLVNRLVLSWDAANAAWDRWVLAFGPDTQADLLLAIGFDIPRPVQLTLLAAAGMIACLLLMGLAARRRSRGGSDPAVALYSRFCGRLARVVRSRGPSETPTHYAAAVAAVRPDLAAVVSETTRVYLEARYGGDVPADTERRLGQLVRTFRPRRAPR